MNQIATIAAAPLPAPTAANPMPAWPVSLINMADAVATNWQLDPTTGHYRDVPTLKEMPTETQRTALEKHRSQIMALLDQRPINGEEFAKRMFGLIAKLMLAKPSRAGGPEAAEARAEAYEIALEDVPWWAVSIAIRKWHRGHCGSEYDYKWAPESADLRKLAMREIKEPHARVLAINRVLTAAPYVDCETIRQRNQAAFIAAFSGKVPPGMPIDDAAEIGRKLIEQKATGRLIGATPHHRLDALAA
jgi:hypothetical protein